MTTKKDMQAILAQLKKEGAAVSMSKSGHYRVRNPATGRSVQIASTPSSHRTIYNALTRLRRIGLMLKPTCADQPGSAR